MATFTCWCGNVVRANGDAADAGHVLWGLSDGFYESVAKTVQGFYDARQAGNSSEWLKAVFGKQYPTDATGAEVIQDVVSTQSMTFCSGICRCPKCRRVHIQIAGSKNRWESFVPESRISGEE